MHAGIRPGIPLDAQAEDDLLGIRQSFLASEQNFDAVIVHGHSANRRRPFEANRIASTQVRATGAN